MGLEKLQIHKKQFEVLILNIKVESHIGAIYVHRETRQLARRMAVSIVEVVKVSITE
jgi:hypothetical protein